MICYRCQHDLLTLHYHGGCDACGCGGFFTNLPNSTLIDHMRELHAIYLDHHGEGVGSQAKKAYYVVSDILRFPDFGPDTPAVDQAPQG